MKRCIGLILIVLLSGPLTVLGRANEFRDPRLAAIDDPLRVEFSGATGVPTKEKLREVISIVASSRDWKVLAESEGRFELARTVSGKHTMRIALAYDERGYGIRYLESLNLLYNEAERTLNGRNVRAIHRNYNLWIRELASSIDAALGVSDSAFASAPPTTPLPRNVKVVAPGTDLPKEIAAYSGVWGGIWSGGRPHTLVVERIEGRAVSFIYSFDPARAANGPGRGWRRVAGTIGDDGVLRGTMEGRAGAARVSYKLSADRKKLLGELSVNGRTRSGTFERRHLPAKLSAGAKD